MKMSYRQLSKLYQGLKDLTSDESLELSGKMHVAAGVNISRVLAELEPFELSIQKAQRLFRSTITKATTQAELAAHEGEIAELYDGEVEVALKPLTVVGINSEKHPVKGHVLSNLRPILTDWAEVAAEEGSDL